MRLLGVCQSTVRVSFNHKRKEHFRWIRLLASPNPEYNSVEVCGSTEIGHVRKGAKMKLFNSYNAIIGLSLVALSTACGSSNDNGSTQTTGTGGAPATGGSAAASASGGAKATGGTTASSTTGASATGGKSSTGGAPATGGTSASAGSSATGGKATGGASYDSRRCFNHRWDHWRWRFDQRVRCRHDRNDQVL